MMALDSLKADESALRKELETAGVHFRGKVCRCPFHDDRTPSAGIYFKDGAWHFKCQGCGFGGDIIDVRAKLNKRTVAEELRAMNDADGFPKSSSRSEPPAPKVYSSLRAIVSLFPDHEDVYADLYADPASGEQTFAIIRWRKEDGKKAFTQCSKTAGGWWMKAPAPPLPIANRAKIATAERVVVVEGEKCIRRLGSVGIVATTSPGGALKGEHADWTPLAGKTVILWPDMDAPDDEFPEGKGVEHMRRVARILQSITPPVTIYWFDPTPLELPAKGDAADVVDRYLESFTAEETGAQINDLLADATPMGVVAEYEKETEAIIAGKRRSIPIPFNMLSDAARALLPGTVTCVCGDPGSGKSLFVGEWVVAWNEFRTLLGNDFDVRVAVYHLEDDRNYHLRRMHAQISGLADITDNKWVEANPTLMRESTKQFRRQLEEIGRCIWESPQDETTLEMLLAWVETRVKAKTDIIIIDPVTAAQGASRPWVEDLKFVTKAKWLGKQSGCRFIFITHPAKGVKSAKASHNDMAGGAAYSRFSHTVLWVERNDTDSQFAIKAGDSPAEYIVPNRIVSIHKARNGPGAGRKIAFNFNPKTLRFDELGMIQREAPLSS